MKLNQELISKLSKGEGYTKLKRESQIPLLKAVLRAAFINEEDVHKIDSGYIGDVFGRSKNFKRRWACGYDCAATWGKQVPLQYFLQVENNLTISRENLQTIYNKVCDVWKDKLEELVSEDLFADEYEIPLSLLRQGYKEAGSGVKELLEKHFGDNCKEQEMVFDEGKVYISVSEAIVMCTGTGKSKDHFQGVCLKEGEGEYAVGNFSDSWVKSRFKPFTGVIGFK